MTFELHHVIIDDFALFELYKVMHLGWGYTIITLSSDLIFILIHPQPQSTLFITKHYNKLWNSIVYKKSNYNA